MSRFGGGAAAAVLATVIALSGVAGWASVPLPDEEVVPGDDSPSPDVEDSGDRDPRDRPMRPRPGGDEGVVPDSGRPGADRSADPIRKPTRPRPDGDVPFTLVEKGFWSY